MRKIVRSGAYQIVNEVNGKSYVGSSKNIDARWSAHRGSFKLPKMPTESLLWRAVQKYGIENFTFIVLEECEPTKTALLALEQHYIDTLNPEYNIMRVAGSRLGSKQSEEVKEKVRQANLGRKNSPEAIANMKAAAIGRVPSPECRARSIECHTGLKQSKEQIAHRAAAIRAKNTTNREAGIAHHNTGRTHTEETKEYMRKLMTGRISPMLGKNHSDETKEKLRIISSRPAPWATGWPKGVARGTPSWNKGKPMSEEAKAKMIASKRAKREAAVNIS